MTSQTLSVVYASGGQMPLIAIELSCAAWPAPVLFCNGFEDHECGTEDGRVLLFEASDLEASLPKKSNTGAQTLRFAVPNIDGRVQRLTDLAIDAGAHCFLTLRIYTPSNLSYPAEPPYRMRVTGGSMKEIIAQVEAGFFDVINTRWPRDSYTTDFARGLTYS